MPKRKSARSFYYEPREPGRGRRGRTWRKLLAESVLQLRKGRVPSIAEVAVGANVSRATAYRYLPTRSKLVNAVIAEALAPVRKAVPQQGDARRRLHELLDRTYSRFREYEPHMRAALQLALEHQALERAGLLEEEPFRRGQRREILKVAIAPLQSRLAPGDFERLLKALAVVYGIEAMIILKDICGASDRETKAIVRWMMNALVEAALRESKPRTVTLKRARVARAPTRARARRR